METRERGRIGQVLSWRERRGDLRRDEHAGLWSHTFDQAGLSDDSNAYLAAAEAAWTWAENNPDG